MLGGQAGWDYWGSGIVGHAVIGAGDGRKDLQLQAGVFPWNTVHEFNTEARAIGAGMSADLAVDLAHSASSNPNFKLGCDNRISFVHRSRYTDYSIEAIPMISYSDPLQNGHGKYGMVGLGLAAHTSGLGGGAGGVFLLGGRHYFARNVSLVAEIDSHFARISGVGTMNVMIGLNFGEHAFPTRTTVSP